MASRGVNKVIILGNLGQDPEVRFLPNGSAVANITVATSESWKDKQTGEPKEKTEWHSVSLFGKLAEVAGEYLKKGSKVYIEGQLQTRKWQNQQGQDQYKTEVVVQGYNGIMQMLDSRGQGGGASQGGFQQQAPAQSQYNQAPAQQGGYQQQAPAQSGGFQQQRPPAHQPPAHQAPAQPGGYQQREAPAHSGGYQQREAPAHSSGFQQQKQQPAAPKVNPQEPTIDFDDDIPF